VRPKVALSVEGQGMTQVQPKPQSVSQPGFDGSAWLFTLVAAFDRAEHLADVPCDARLLAEARARLSPPSPGNAPSAPQQALELQH
jgi:hypothetical protein